MNVPLSLMQASILRFTILQKQKLEALRFQQGLLVEKHEHDLCAMQPPLPNLK